MPACRSRSRQARIASVPLAGSDGAWRIRRPPPVKTGSGPACPLAEFSSGPPPGVAAGRAQEDPHHALAKRLQDRQIGISTEQAFASGKDEEIRVDGRPGEDDEVEWPADDQPQVPANRSTAVCPEPPMGQIAPSPEPRHGPPAPIVEWVFRQVPGKTG